MVGSGAPRVLEEDTERTVGRRALRNNVAAAVALAGAVRSTLGPFGMDKMLMDSDGGLIVTNDGVTVLSTAKVEHPTAQMLISASEAQDRVARDGTTTAVVLTAELLQNALELVERGVHPTLVQQGFRAALDLVMERLTVTARPLSGPEQHLAAVRTSLAGRGDEDRRVVIAELALEAAQLVGRADEEGRIVADPTLIKTVADQGSTAQGTRLVHGLVLAKRRRDPRLSLPEGACSVVLLDGALERRSMVMNASLKVTTPGGYAAFLDRERDEVRRHVQAIIDSGAQVVIAREGIDDDAARQLSQAGITSYRRMERADLELVARSTGGRLVTEPTSIDWADLGRIGSLREEKWHGTWHLILVGADARGATLVLRGTSGERQAESERAFSDALGVACQLLEEPAVLPGGGATAMTLARHLRAHAASVEGRAQLAIEAYASALEVVPRILAENAGLDPIDQILGLAADQRAALDAAGSDGSGPSDADWIGLDLVNRTTARMDELGIIEPLRVTRQAVQGATEGAISVLRIDDLVWAKSAPGTPDWEDPEDKAAREERENEAGHAGFAGP